LSEIRHAAPVYFHKLFTHNNCWNVFPRLVVKRKLTKPAGHWLIRPVSREKVTNAVLQLLVEKALGSGGFLQVSFRGIGAWWVRILPRPSSLSSCEVD